MKNENITILVADDDAAERKLFRTFLHRKGYEVIEAADGLEALDLVRSSRPDIIISDLEMPNMTGLQLLECMAEKYQDIPFILISGVGTLDDVIHGLRRGVWDYLRKPVSPIELLQLSIDRVLERVLLLLENKQKNYQLENLVRARTSDLLSQNMAYEREIKQRQYQEQKARSAVDEWRSTVDALPEMIAIIDQERRISRLNKPMLDLLGKSEEELKGAACFFCNTSHHCIQEEVVRTKAAGKSELYLEEVEKYLELDVVPYTSTDGDFSGSIHVFRDVTQQKRDQKEKEILQSQLLHAQKLESVGQLASGIAHEINTPAQFVNSNMVFLEEAFTDITTCFQKIIERSASGPVSTDVINSILDEYDWEYLKKEGASAIIQSKEGLNRISSIVRAMKEFSHPGGKELEATDVNHLIEVTVTVARNEWKYTCNVQLDLDPDLPHVQCLSDELGQVVLNLLVNAAHAIQDRIGENPEQQKGIIRITTSFSEVAVFITISDDGNGILPHVQDKIFDPFFTTKSVGKGTGQGLAIAYDVVKNKHKGSLTFSTQQGEGTCFTIELPR